MKKYTFLLFLLLFVLENLDAQYIYFNKRISINNYWDVCRGIITYKNGFWVAGVFGDEFDVPHLYLSQLDSVGNLNWTQDYKIPGYKYYLGLSGSLFLTTDKYFAICGSRVPQPKGYSLIIKADSLGNKIWEKEYQFSNANNNINSGSNTIDNGLILTGRIKGDSDIKGKYLLFKTDYLGNLLWYKTYTDYDPNRNYYGSSVVQTPDKGYCIGGGGNYWDPPTVDCHGIMEIIKTDSLGNFQWKRSFCNPIYSNGGSILCLTRDSCVLLTYVCTVRYINEYYDYKQPYLTKIGMDGSIKWEKKIASVQPCPGISWISQINDGGFILCGGHRVEDSIFKCVSFLYKFNSNCDSLWYREYEIIHGENEMNGLSQVTQTPDNGFAAAGSLYPDIGNGTQDIWVLKTDSLGCLVPNCTGIGITEFNPNSGPQMLVYPNPFTNAFAINYNIPKESHSAIFQLHDINGVLIYQTSLTKEVKQLQVIANVFKPGIYFASLIIDDIFTPSIKIIKQNEN